ncbi:MAG: hypothetical protein QE272_11195 [Nevskia sp.]|nr:hypothetical protein [Nevskia sp.]
MAIDRWLKPLTSWGMLALSLVLFGPLSAIYFVFCWLVSGAIDRFVTRKEREETWQRAGLSEEEVDLKMLPRDRMARVIRSAFSLGAAAALHLFG